MITTKRIVESLRSFDIPAEKRNEYLCVAIATALGSVYELPGQKVKSIARHYNENVRRNVVDFINAINEHIVFDAKEAVELTSRVYYMRYGFAFEPQSFSVAEQLVALMGIDSQVTPVKYTKLLSDQDCAKAAMSIRRDVMDFFVANQQAQKEASDHPAPASY